MEIAGDDTRMFGGDSSPTTHVLLLPFEHLLSEISARLTLASPATVQQDIQEGLRLLTEFFDVDRSMLCEQSADHREILERASYTRPGTPTGPEVAPLHLSFPGWCACMLRGDIVRFSALTDLPPEASHERAYAERTGLRAYLSVPISLQSERRHHLVLVSFRRERAWPDVLIPRLRLLGEMFAGTLERAWIEQALRESEQRYREVFELTSDCIFLLDVTPEMRFVVARTGQPVVLSSLPDDVLQGLSRDAAHATLIQTLGCRSPSWPCRSWPEDACSAW